jgi:hypothetical protein
MILKLDIPCLVVCHTKKSGNSKNQQIDLKDIRGPMTITNKSEFLYIFERFDNTTKTGLTKVTRAFIKNRKDRISDTSNNIYELKYVYNTKLYSGDERVSFESFNEAWKSRDKLDAR